MACIKFKHFSVTNNCVLFLSIDENVKQMEAKIMALVEESSALRISPDPDVVKGSNNMECDPAKSLSKAQEASALERQLIKLQDNAGVSDSHNLDITFSVRIICYW